MAFDPASWYKNWQSWFKASDKSQGQKKVKRNYSTRRFHIESLEDRDLLTTVNLDTSSLYADSSSIVIEGADFAPIVANNSIVFNKGL